MRLSGCAGAILPMYHEVSGESYVLLAGERTRHLFVCVATRPNCSSLCPPADRATWTSRATALKLCPSRRYVTTLWVRWRHVHCLARSRTRRCATERGGSKTETDPADTSQSQNAPTLPGQFAHVTLRARSA